jgi:hypothetical protein
MTLLRVVGKLREARQRRAFVLDHGVRAHDVHVRTRREHRGDRLQPPRHEHVIDVELHDVVTAGGLRRRVERRAGPAVLLAHDLELLVVAQLAQPGVEVVRGAVVADHDLVRRMGLGEHGSDRVCDPRLALVVGDHHRQTGRRPRLHGPCRGRDAHGPSGQLLVCGHRVRISVRGPPVASTHREEPARRTLAKDLYAGVS